MEMTDAQRERYYEKLLHYINTNRGYAKYSGVRVTKVAPDYCNYLGIVHGGCLATLADTVAGIAACSRGRGTVTLNYGFSFHRQAKGTVIKCVAEPEKVGHKVSVFRCSLTDDQGNLVASGQFTFFMTL